MMALPLSTEDLPAGLPARPGRPRADYLGHTLVRVDTEAKPALFRPRTAKPEEKTVHAAFTPPITLKAIREALSLEADTFVDDGIVWNDYGQLSALSEQEQYGTGDPGRLPHRTGRTSSVSTGVSTIKLSSSGIRELAEESLGRTLRALERADNRTRVAVSRWKMAKNTHRSLTDRFIDLRVAMESLFLPQKPDQELKFRLAVSGAWLVGKNAGDRRRVWDTLRRAYELASTAVHGGDVKGKKKDGRSSEAVLLDGLAECRRGIRRILNEGQINDWTELILGRADSTGDRAEE